MGNKLNVQSGAVESTLVYQARDGLDFHLNTKFLYHYLRHSLT